MKKKILKPLWLLMSLVMVFFLSGCASDTAGEKMFFDDGISSNARLANLTLSNGELNYAFNPYDWVYEADVPFEIASIKITPTAQHSHATVSIQGVVVESGSASESIPLAVGENSIDVIVTAWDGTEGIYTVTVTRLESNNANLASIAVTDNGGSVPVNLKETFNANTLEYTAVVNDSVDSIGLNIAAQEGSFEVQKAGGGTLYDITDAMMSNIDVDPGLNRFLITVTAPDGTTRRYYTLSITQLIGDATNGKVTNFGIQGVTLNPAYQYDDYPSWGDGTVQFEADAIIAIGKMEGDEPVARLALITESSVATATVTINGETTEIDDDQTNGGLEFPLKAKPSSGSAYNSGAFEGFEVDTNYEMVVTVRSGDGSTHISTFTVNIEVTSGSSNADLSGLRIFWGTNDSERVIYPGSFTHDATYHNPQTYVAGTLNPNQTGYVAVVYGTETVKIVATPAESTVTYVRFNGAEGTLVNGSYVYSVVLSKGLVTRINIEILPESGRANQIKTYTLDIKLLNAYEYYWGIYGPMNNKSFVRWTAEFGTQGVKTVNIRGVIAGNLEWKVELSGVRPRNTMTWEDYRDGNRNYGGYSLNVDYNDNHPTDNALHGFMMDGAVSGLLDGISSKNGTITGGFNLYSPWGDYIGRVNANYVVEGGIKMENVNSYADFEYMGETVRMMYRDDNDGNSQMSPYPFTATYDWSQPWNPGSY